MTRIAEFGAFVELEPGIEALAHASTFAPTGRSEEWSRLVTPEMTGAFEILSIDLDKKRIGVALVPEGSARAGGTASSEAVLDVHETDEASEQTERKDPVVTEGFGSLADKLRGALKPRE